MTKSVVHTSGAPEAVGPYSQAIVSDDLVFCSGQVALDPGSGELTGATVSEQTKRAMDNLRAVLQEAGCGFDDVIKVTAFLIDMNDFVAFNEVYAGYFSNEPPARATVGVVGLPKGASVEVECVARLPKS